MKTFKEVKTGDTLYIVRFSDNCVGTMTVRKVCKSDYATKIHYSWTKTHCSIIEELFCLEVYESDLDKCWLHDTLSYAVCTDYDAIDVAIRDNNPNYKKRKRKR